MSAFIELAGRKHGDDGEGRDIKSQCETWAKSLGRDPQLL